MSTQTISIGPDDLIEIEQVGGDLEVLGFEGPDLQTRGDQVRIERRSDAVAISCGSDLSISVPRTVRLSAGTIGGDARIQDLDGPVELQVVGGDAILRNLLGPVELSGMIGGDTHIENVAHLSMSAGGRRTGYDVADRIRRQVERATRRAERKVSRAEQKLHQVGRMGFRWSTGSDAPEPLGSASPVSDEERMAILRMLQEKKITSEQADKLLSALEGNS